VETIKINEKTIQAVSPEGQTASISLEQLFEAAAPSGMNTRGIVLPDGVKLIDSRGPITLWVHETPPRVYGFKWIAKDSPSRFGRGTKYETVRIALPYLVVIASFEGSMLGGSNECFFRTRPLENEDDDLCYPALLNCSKFTPQEGRPLSWICTANLGPGSRLPCRQPKQRMRTGFRALLHCLLETGFNYSSEDHEGSSWFTETVGAKVDPRIAGVEAWAKASQEDPLFVLDVPWLKTGLSVRGVVDRMFQLRKVQQRRVLSAADVARIVFNHRLPRTRRKIP